MVFDPVGFLFTLWLAVGAAAVLTALAHVLKPGFRRIVLQARLTTAWSVLTVLAAAVGAPGSAPLADGPFGWVMAAFVIGLTAVVQTFSVRFLQGDEGQGRAFGWLTLLMTGAVAAWLATDTRLLGAGWGLALFALTRLIGLADDWAAARTAARFAGLWLLAAWAALAGVIGVLHAHTGTWAVEGLGAGAGDWSGAGRQIAAGLLVLAVVIPAAQWPLHRWLLATMVAPTPVSAIMHAGVVNAGALLLIRFGGVFDGAEWARVALMAFAVASILLGSGMMLVQADVKRRLACSTIAQMGCMLLQCALGAYLAAVIHLLLHGLFKASLFLQAGDAVRQERAHQGTAGLSFARVFIPALVLTGALVALQPAWWPAGPAGWLSALLLAWFSAQALERPVGSPRYLLPFWGAALGGFLVVQAGLHHLFEGGIPRGTAPAGIWVGAAAVTLIAGTALLYRLTHGRSGTWFRRAYWFLVHASEPPASTIDPHPAHLTGRIYPGAAS